MILRVHVGRWRCRNAGCKRRIFAERPVRTAEGRFVLREGDEKARILNEDHQGATPEKNIAGNTAMPEEARGDSGETEQEPGWVLVAVLSRMEQPKVNQLLGSALKSLYDIEVYLRKSTLEPELRELVKLRVSQINRCAYCIIYHRRDALKLGVTDQKIHLLNAWQEAPEYSDRERAALAWAEAVTLISAHHLPDDV